MIEIRGDKKVLITPVSAEDLKDIHIGDIVWLDGDLMTCRDVAHRRLVEYGRELPYNIKDKAIFHAGPIVRKIEGTEDDYEMVSVGPTTSMRMEKFEREFVEQTGVKVIIGKGGEAIKKVGIEARRDLEQMLGCKVFLDMQVKVKKNWRRDLNQIRRFGYGEGM